MAMADHARVDRAEQGPAPRGWAFVGPTTVYAAMQAMGIVDDHLEGCFVRPTVEEERARFARPTR